MTVVIDPARPTNVFAADRSTIFSAAFSSRFAIDWQASCTAAPVDGVLGQQVAGLAVQFAAQGVQGREPHGPRVEACHRPLAVSR